MACGGGKYPEDFFKKDKMSYASKDTSIRKNSSEEKSSVTNDSEKKLIGNVSDYLMEFDRIIAKLYGEIAEEIKTIKKLNESDVKKATDKIREEIYLAHRRRFKRFPDIDFCVSENLCGYLRRYAVCHTGLVKEAIGHFFNAKKSSCKKARNIILNSDLCKVVSLGGGPGNDLIGFCSALDKIPNRIKELDLKIVDISEGWEFVFPAILRKASCANFGSVSALLKKVEITREFLERNLLEDEIFDDTTLSNILGEVDVVLMVKFISFIPRVKVKELIQNVVNSMKEGAYLFFIDSPLIAEYFVGVQGLHFIYRRGNCYYKLSFKPSRYHMDSVEGACGSICIFCKELGRTLSHRSLW